MFLFKILSFSSRRYGTTIRDMKRKSRRLFLIWRIGFVISWSCIRIPLFTISVNIRAISGTDTYGWAGSAVLRLRRASRWRFPFIVSTGIPCCGRTAILRTWKGFGCRISGKRSPYWGPQPIRIPSMECFCLRTRVFSILLRSLIRYSLSLRKESPRVSLKKVLRCSDWIGRYWKYTIRIIVLRGNRTTIFTIGPWHTLLSRLVRTVGTII